MSATGRQAPGATLDPGPRPGRVRRFEPIAVWGLLVTVLLHGGAFVGIMLYRQRLQAAVTPPPPTSFVVAKLVRLGKPLDPKRLPDREVPQEATRKDDGVDLSQDADVKPTPKKPKTEDKLADKLRSALNKAALMDKAQRESDVEGDPSGSPSGTAKTASEGDVYITRIADLWNRTWTLPSIIAADEAKKLFVLVTLKMDRQGKLELPVALDRPSGNEHFDNSIKAAWEQIKKVPAPPAERAASIVAHGLKLKLTWKGLQ
ncbi:MAG: TonB C-terminal domain-containing protein [Deltaproteobacteria bacterium]|nr:TonB C-terminal domain-containing protein [Deltaproteobacteria bacterium]